MTNITEIQKTEILDEIILFFENYPTNVYFSQFSDLLFEILKLIFHSNDFIIKKLLTESLINQF